MGGVDMNGSSSSPPVDEGDGLSWKSIASRIDTCIPAAGEPGGASRTHRPVEQSFAQQSRFLVCASLQAQVSLHSSCTGLVLQGTRSVDQPIGERTADDLKRSGTNSAQQLRSACIEQR